MGQQGSVRDHFAFTPEFLDQLSADPEGALKLLGVSPTPEIMSALGYFLEDRKALEQMMALAKEVADQETMVVWP